MRILVLVIASDSPAYYVEMQKVWVRRIAGRQSVDCTAKGGVRRCTSGVRCMTDGHVRCSGCTCGDAFGGVRRIAGRRAPSVIDSTRCTSGDAFGGVRRCTSGVTDGHVRCSNSDIVDGCNSDIVDGCNSDIVDGCNSDIVDVWFVKAKPARLWVGDIANDGPLSDTVEFDREAMTIYVKGEETYIPGILNKTIEAIRAIGLDYDFVWRTNLSSVLDFDGLIRYCNSVHNLNREVLDKSHSKNREVFYKSHREVFYKSHREVFYKSHREVFYAGYIGLAPIEAEFDSHIRFASGSGFLLSREAVQYLLDNVSLLQRDLIDDVAIGALLEPQFGIVHLDRCWIKTGEENIARMVELYAERPLGHKQLGIFHFRCETYQHERTVEFMNMVDRGLHRLSSPYNI